MANIHDYHNNGTDSNNTNGSSNAGGFSSIPIIPPQENEENTVLDRLINHNECADKYEPALFRDQEYYTLLSILTSSRRPNALLVGDASVGKTQLVKELARRIVTKDPLTMQFFNGYTVYELPVSNIASGNSYVGQVEKTIDDIFNFASNPNNKVILFMDEIHQLISNNDSTSAKATEQMKTHMNNTDLKLIGATTTQESTKLLADPAFKRRWADVLISELTAEQTLEILHNIKPALEKHHNVGIDDTLLEKVVSIGDEYRPHGMHKPGTAIQLLDRAMSDTKIKNENKKLKLISDPNLKPLLSTTMYPIVNEDQIKKSAITLITGDESSRNENVQDIQDYINQKIIGQNNAKDVLFKELKRQSLHLTRRTTPISFLFAGPTGTGKTAIAEALAEVMDKNNNSYIYLNMTEYNNDSKINRILGSPTGYVGSDKNHELVFDTLKTNPYQIIVFDEFEKAAESIQNLTMQILDKGELKTERGELIDFSRSIVIMTTNAGVEEMAQKAIGFGQKTEIKKQDVIENLKGTISDAILNRFTHVTYFNPIDKQDFKKILAVKYNKVIKEAIENRPDLAFEPSHIDINDLDQYEALDGLVAEHYDPILNGRPAERVIRGYIEDIIIENDNHTQFKLLERKATV